MDDDCGVRRLTSARCPYRFLFLTAIETKMHMRNNREKKRVDALEGACKQEDGRKM
jgi:hypothetical protein